MEGCYKAVTDDKDLEHFLFPCKQQIPDFCGKKAWSSGLQLLFTSSSEYFQGSAWTLFAMNYVHDRGIPSVCAVAWACWCAEQPENFHNHLHSFIHYSRQLLNSEHVLNHLYWWTSLFNIQKVWKAKMVFQTLWKFWNLADETENIVGTHQHCLFPHPLVRKCKSKVVHINADKGQLKWVAAMTTPW